MNKTAARQVLDLLVNRFDGEFVCIPECKTGSPNFGPRELRIDLWCMAKSWAQPRTIGFEIKVSRSDFLNDHKWGKYLDYCSEFYFVCPWGLIDKAELPEEAGLIYCTKNLTRTMIKKKAPARQVDIPESIFRYILMWRATIIKSDQGTNSDPAEYWRQWVENRYEDEQVGHLAGRKIAQGVKARVGDVQQDNIRLQREITKLEPVRDFLNTAGINLNQGYWDKYQIKRKLEEALSEAQIGLPVPVLEYLSASIQNLTRVHKILTGRLNGGGE
jgi:DNA repair protein MmcB-like